ncbi:MAG: hypothetical protein R3284_01580 [Rubricoccaceae bacterium]|nr:hypothetical protein [Rubricoccaceae bacterium]
MKWSTFILSGFSLFLFACPEPEPELPAGPPVEVAYAAVCDSTWHQQMVILEGYLHLFPRLLSCYPDEAARTGRSCQVKLLPTVDAPTGSTDIEEAYYTTFIDEGGRPNEARSQGYGFGPPLKVFTSDSTEVDPYDRVRITGRFHARGRATGGEGLLCTLDAQQIEIAEHAVVSWADERQAERDSLQARIDSLRLELGYPDSSEIESE